jgi:hypothetical protein
VSNKEEKAKNGADQWKKSNYQLTFRQTVLSLHMSGPVLPPQTETVPSERTWQRLKGVASSRGRPPGPRGRRT